MAKTWGRVCWVSGFEKMAVLVLAQVSAQALLIASCSRVDFSSAAAIWSAVGDSCSSLE